MCGRIVKVTRDNIPPDEPGAGSGFACVFQSGDMQTRKVMLRLRNHLRTQGVDDATLGTAELVLAEVCNNITEHGYATAPGPIQLVLHCEGDGLVCIVTDYGVPLPEGTPPSAPPDPPWCLPEGGFGWHIIRTLTDRLDYHCHPGFNRLDLRIPILPVN